MNWSLVKVLPACVFVSVALIAPVLYFLYQSIANPEIPNTLGRTIAALENWQPPDLPSEQAYQALAADLREIEGTPSLFKLARRLNNLRTGYRTLILKTANSLPGSDYTGSYRSHFNTSDKRWQQPDVWSIIKQESGPFTPHYLLSALDLKRDAQGMIARVPANRAIYQDVFARTIWMSLVITGACLVIGYPVAYLVANADGRYSKWITYAILLPFWTSLLVRTLAWIVLLQNNGVVGASLKSIGLADGSPELLHTRPAVYIGMIHIMLPFMVLSLVAVMRGISPWHLRAALSLGATPAVAFWRVYVPQSAPGIGAGILLVLIVSLGFYITPALLGGPGDQMISYFIAFNTNDSLNWGLAAALSTWLLLFAGALFLAVNYTIGINRGGLS